MSARWIPGYTTSGLAHHRLEDALRLLHAEGFNSAVITPDAAHLDPASPHFVADVERTRAVLGELGLVSLVETGSRFLLDPSRKHFPTLLNEPELARQRVRFLRVACDLATQLGANVVSLWSGSCPAEISAEQAWTRLRENLLPLLDDAARQGLSLAFEPEPGMFVQTVAEWHELRDRVGRHQAFKLALDCGHVLATGEGDPAQVIRREFAHCAWIAIEDMRRGVHEHLPFGSGDLDLPAVVQALDETAFAGIVAVELPRDAHRWAAMLKASRAALCAAGASAVFQRRP